MAVDEERGTQGERESIFSLINMGVIKVCSLNKISEWRNNFQNNF